MLKMKKILLDTDIGSDIDDAVCLAYLLMQPEAKLLGITTVTGQVTLRAQMADEMSARFTHPVLQPVLDFSEVWFQEQERLFFHDPLAAVCLFNPAVCTFTSGQVTVNSDAAAGELGKTDFTSNTQGPPHQVALTINPEAFFEAFFSVFD